MKVTSGWIKEWLRRTMLSDSELVEALERAGIEVEQVISSNEIDKRVVAALVKKVVQHPGADRLKLVEVQTGEGSHTIVCGATNVRVGMKVALAQIGTTLPGGDRIEKAKLRGEVSEGMLCSELELKLGLDHNGIMELSSDTPMGMPLSEIYPADTVMDIKTPANRSDVQSIVGLAREVAAMTSTKSVSLAPPLVKFSAHKGVLADKLAASRYTLARIKVDQPSHSPRGMAARLRAAGVRTIGPVVDVTNYVLLETGQPLHSFDAAKVSLPIDVRYAREGEKLVTLDGVRRTLSEADLVIADAHGPIALAGLMGGQSTEVSAKTGEILLESAVFDGVTIRKMAQRHGLRTEASVRFERGLPAALPPLGLARAIQLLEQVAGGELVDAVDQLNERPWITRIGLPVKRLSKLLGIGISHKETVAALAKLEISATSFDIIGETHKLIGRPYRFGASYKTDREAAFDCSYLVDYVYSLIGLRVGFTALGQYETGQPVELAQLRPGDAVFTEGDREDVVQDHYFTRPEGGVYVRHAVKPPRKVGHVGLYVGAGKVVHASPGAGQVAEVELAQFTDDPGFLGARRFADDLNDYVSVTEVPWWRTDLKIIEDLAEEVVRVIGYDKIPSTIPSWRPRRIAFDNLRSVRRRLRDILWAAGAFEVMTYSFISAEQLEGLGLATGDHLKLKNPLSSEQAYLRSSLLPSHVATLERNRMYAKTMRFYEISGVFVKRGKGEQPDEPLRLGATVLEPEAGYVAAKGMLDAIARELHVELTIRPSDEGQYAPGRYGEVWLGKHKIGGIGQLHPGLVRTMKFEGEVAHFELDLTPLMAASSTRPYVPVSTYPTMVRDVTMLVPLVVTWEDVRITTSAWDVAFVSDYYGPELPGGMKSLTIRLKLTLPDRTPTEAEAAALEESVLARLGRKLGVTSRD